MEVEWSLYNSFAVEHSKKFCISKYHNLRSLSHYALETRKCSWCDKRIPDHFLIQLKLLNSK